MEKTAVDISRNCSLQGKNLAISVPMDAASGQTYSSGDDLQNGPKSPKMELEVCSAQHPAWLSFGAPSILLSGEFFPGFPSLDNLTVDLGLLRENIGSLAFLKRCLGLNQGLGALPLT